MTQLALSLDTRIKPPPLSHPEAARQFIAAHPAWMARVLAECQARGEVGAPVSVKAVVELLRHEVPGGVNNNWTATFADWVVEQDPTLRVQRKRRAQ